MEEINSITGAIIADAIAVHREFGPGMLESTYEACLTRLLKERGLRVERQVGMPVSFQGQVFDPAYRIDLLVERRVVVELKVVAALNKVHFAQMMTYLRHSNCEVGLLINFDVMRLTDGIRRVIRGDWPIRPAPSPSPPRSQ